MDVRIYRPARNPMQSGWGRSKEWVMEFEPGAPRVVEPLMGWTGCADTKGQVRLRFTDSEKAVAFAERHRLSYELIEPKKRSLRPKSYADNFRPRRQP